MRIRRFYLIGAGAPSLRRVSNAQRRSMRRQNIDAMRRPKQSNDKLRIIPTALRRPLKKAAAAATTTTVSMAVQKARGALFSLHFP